MLKFIQTGQLHLRSLEWKYKMITVDVLNTTVDTIPFSYWNGNLMGKVKFFLKSLSGWYLTCTCKNSWLCVLWLWRSYNSYKATCKFSGRFFWNIALCFVSGMYFPLPWITTVGIYKSTPYPKHNHAYVHFLFIIWYSLDICPP